MPEEPWNPHTPGDPMPCKCGDSVVEVMLRGGGCDIEPASYWDWGKSEAYPNYEITAWRFVERKGEDVIAADPYDALSQHLHGDGDAPPIRITYRNWRGEVSERNIVPQSVWFGATEWHPEPQWLLSALDTDKGAARDFALADFGANDDTWRTRALAAEAEVERLRGLTTGAIGIFENCSVETGVCCCGEDMERHSTPMDCGHTPTDMGAYQAFQWLDAARAALAEGGPDDR